MLQRLVRGGRTSHAARVQVRALFDRVDAEHAEGSDTDDEQDDLDEDSDYYESDDDEVGADGPPTALVLLPLTRTHAK